MTDPWHHPWLSGLFGDTELSKLLAPEAELARMLEVEAAWSSIIAPDTAKDRLAATILNAPVRPENLRDGMARDGVPVPDLVRRLKAALAEDDHQWVHRGLTSQDVIDTSLTLALRDVLPVIQARLTRLITALDQLTARDGTRTLMGMTRMQPALPITVADRVAGWGRALRHLLDIMPALTHRVTVLQWGGPVGLRDGGFEADTGARFAARLGLRDPGAAWHSDRARLVELAEVLSRISGATGKIGQDIALLAQTTPSALHLTGGGGSSAMPHKQNPVLAELVVTLARRNAGDLSLMHQSLVHEQERSGTAWMVEWMVLPQMLMTTGRSLTASEDLIATIARMGAADGA